MPTRTGVLDLSVLLAYFSRRMGIMDPRSDGTADQNWSSSCSQSIISSLVFARTTIIVWLDTLLIKTAYTHELAPFLDSGFVFGQIQSKSTRDYSKSANSQLGSCWIFHELIGSKKIKYESFPQYYDQE